MTRIKLQIFPTAGTINVVFNDFSEFILNRKSLSEATERRFVNKLQSLSGITNSPMSLLQQRIDNNEIDYKKNVWGRGIINEMENIIIKHSRKF